MQPRSLLARLPMLALTLGCTGEIDGAISMPDDRTVTPTPAGAASGPTSMPGGNGGGVTVPPSPETMAACQTQKPAPSPLRRLTRLEYAHTVRDLLGVTDSPSHAFAPDAHALGFDNIASAQTVSQLLVEQYEDAGARLAASAVQDLPKLLRCDPATTGEDACARKFIAEFGRRAWRRPLAATEQTRLATFYTTEKTRHGFPGALEQVVAAFLQSPHFLYRVELGTDPTATGTVKLTPFELASRLSYLVWSSMPDEPLLVAAEGGRLGTAQEVAAQAQRMLADARARPAIAHFHRQWLELEAIDEITKSATVYPSFTPALRTLMKREGSTFLEELLFTGDARMATLFSADYTYANNDLAKFYGMTGPTGSTFVKTKLPPTRSGYLTQAAFLSVHAKADQSSPIDRGKFIRERLFCQDLPAPPNDVEIIPPVVKPGETTRQRFKAHTESPSCAGCHVLIDPTGFPLEGFDGIGAWRDRDQGLPIDTSGDLTGTDVSGAFNGAVELGRRIASSEMARNCVVTHWFRYGHGREETEADACTMSTLRDQFRASGQDMRKLIVALTQTPAFLARSAGGTP